MNGPEKVARRLHDMQTKIDRVGAASQLGNTTIGGETAVAVADVVTEAVVTNDALPDVQEDVADGNEGVSDLSAMFDSFDEDMDARFEDARAELDDKAAEIEASMTQIDETFSTQYEGLSADVDTAIQAAGSAKTEAEAASDAARDAAGLAASKGETITQVSAPTGSRANAANLWIDNSLNTAAVPKNQPNRYGPVTVPDPNAVALILPAATAKTETEVLRISVAPGATTPVSLTLSVSMNLASQVKSSIARLRDGVTGAVLASYVFSDKGDSSAGNQETWTLPAGFTATPSASMLVLTIQSNNANSPAIYSLHRTITASNWQAITDQKALDAAATASTAAAAAQAAKDVAAQANTAAGVAQQTATDANTAALNAAGIANAKGKVIRQQSKPTGANAAVGNLWIRSSDNTPWVYDATAADWVQVTDQVAIDAAANAAKAQQDATAASNAAKAAQATADSKPLILYSSTAGPSGTAPNGTIWFLWDSAKNVAGQWLQSGTLAAPVWTPQQIRSEVIANLDVAKLTAGNAAIAELVAQKIAAATANFQTVNVSNLFVTSGATMSQATIDFLFANVVMAKKITAGMIDVDSLNGISLTGITITGGQFKTAASGRRAELDGGSIRFFDSGGTQRGTIQADVNGKPGLSFLYDAESPAMFIGSSSVPSGVSTTVTIGGSVGIQSLLVGNLRDNTIGSTDGYVYDSSTGTLQAKIVRALGSFMVGGVDVQLGDTGWIQPVLAGGTNDADSPFRYRRLNGVIYFDGLVAPTATNQRMFVLPAGFRPARIRRAWIDRNGTATPTQWIVRVHSGGAIDLIGPSGGSGALDFGGYPSFPAS